MKSLIILRHGDAENKKEGGSDFERVLTGEGRRQAALQGKLLHQVGITLQRLVASSALRTRETAEIVARETGSGTEVSLEESLYNAPGEVLLEYLRGMSNDSSTLLLVAHLPGVAQLLSLLTTEKGDLDQVFSPGTMAGVQLDGESWQELDYGTGSLTLYLPPILPIT